MAQTVAPVADDSEYLGEDPGIARLLDNIQAMVPAVLLPVARMAAWNAIEDFYLRSTWRREMVYWCLPPTVGQIDFNPFDGDWSVCWILYFDGLTYGRVKPPSLLMDTQCPLPTGEERKGAALLALKPVSFASEFDPLLFSTWFETILDGVLSRLYLQPAKPYSNAQLAMQHGRLYRAGCQRAHAIAQMGYTDGPGRWRFPLFANGRRKN